MDDGDNSEQLPISLVAQTVFCPRRAWLEANGEHVESEAITAGTLAHRTSDDPAASTRRALRAVEVHDTELGVLGRCDTVELDAGGDFHIVEHKSTPLRRRAEPTDAMRVQLALQAQALRSMGHTVASASVYFTNHNTRVGIDVGTEATRQARAFVEETRRVVGSPAAPPPLIDDRRCNTCSHASVCLPDENAERPHPRRISVLDPDTQVLYLTDHGGRAALRSGQLAITDGGGELVGRVPIERVQAVSVHGNIDISAAAVRELLWRDIPILWCTSGGRLVGWATSNRRPNATARHAQHIQSGQGRIDIAGAMISAKIANQATLLRRHADGAGPVAELRELSRSAGKAASTTELLGIEGDAAARYFRAFPLMLGQAPRDQELSLAARIGRNAPDPANALLNYAYALLLGDIIRAILSCGLDPHAGFLHTAGRNKPALALDLMEEFRAPIGDSTVLRLLNNGEITRHAFSQSLGTARLTPAGRRKLIHAYEARVTTEFQHPTMGYTVTWRRAMTIQARLILAVLDGTSQRYRAIRIR